MNYLIKKKKEGIDHWGDDNFCKNQLILLPFKNEKKATED